MKEWLFKFLFKDKRLFLQMERERYSYVLARDLERQMYGDGT